MIYRESESELIQLIEKKGIWMTPYYPLVAGKVCRLWDEDTKRNKNDPINKAIS